MFEKRRGLLKGATAVAATYWLSGCGGGGGGGSDGGGSANPQPSPSGPILNVAMSVSGASIGEIGPGFAGLSYEKSTLYERLFSGGNTNLLGMFRRLGPSILRIGGNSVDKSVWFPNGAGRISRQIAPSDVDALAAFLKTSGWQCLYGINLGGSASGATSPKLAAQEVAYVSKALGSSLLGIEIGNECDLYGDDGNYYAGNWSLDQFQNLWSQYRQAILDLTPNVRITGPASGTHTSDWTIPFGKYATKDKISLLTQHYYRANGKLPTSTAEFLITPDDELSKIAADLQGASQSLGIPYRMSECNSFFDGGANGVSNSYASSLWVIDYLFNCAQYGAVGVNLHGGGDGAGYTPIANDSKGNVIEARPEYYGTLLFTLAGQGKLLATNLADGAPNLTGYTVSSSDGKISIVLNNKDSTNNMRVTLNLPKSISNATLLEMTQRSTGATAPSLSATGGVSIQGGTVGINGSFNPNPSYTLTSGGNALTCYVPALSAVLLQLS